MEYRIKYTRGPIQSSVDLYRKILWLWIWRRGYNINGIDHDDKAVKIVHELMDWYHVEDNNIIIKMDWP